MTLTYIFMGIPCLYIVPVSILEPDIICILSIIFNAQEHLTMGQTPFENWWLWKYIARSNSTFSFHGIWHSKLIFITLEHFTTDQIPLKNGILSSYKKHRSTLQWLISLSRIDHLENAFHGPIALYPFMPYDIALYWPRDVSHIMCFLSSFT